MENNNIVTPSNSSKIDTRRSNKTVFNITKQQLDSMMEWNYQQLTVFQDKFSSLVDEINKLGEVKHE